MNGCHNCNKAPKTVERCFPCDEPKNPTGWEAIVSEERSCETCELWESCELSSAGQPCSKWQAKVEEAIVEDKPTGAGWYVAGFIGMNGSWFPVNDSMVTEDADLIKRWLTFNPDREKYKVCQYMMNPHILQPVEEEKSTPGPWEVREREPFL
jgi:hypothetical protein